MNKYAQQAVQEFIQQFGPQSKYKGFPMQSTKMLEAKFVNGRGTFNFPLNVDRDGDAKNDTINKESKLDKNSVFLALQAGIFIYEADTSAQENSKELITYPDTAYFTSGSTFAPADLEWFYLNGKLFVKVQQGAVVDETIRTQEFRYAPQTQSSALADVVTKPQTAPNGGFHNLLRPWVFLGSSENTIRIECEAPSGISWQQDAANKEVRAVVALRGLEIKSVNS